MEIILDSQLSIRHHVVLSKAALSEGKFAMKNGNKTTSSRNHVSDNSKTEKKGSGALHKNWPWIAIFPRKIRKPLMVASMAGSVIFAACGFAASHPELLGWVRTSTVYVFRPKMVVSAAEITPQYDASATITNEDPSAGDDISFEIIAPPWCSLGSPKMDVQPPEALSQMDPNFESFKPRVDVVQPREIQKWHIKHWPGHAKLIIKYSLTCSESLWIPAHSKLKVHSDNEHGRFQQISFLHLNPIIPVQGKPDQLKIATASMGEASITMTGQARSSKLTKSAYTKDVSSHPYRDLLSTRRQAQSIMAATPTKNQIAGIDVDESRDMATNSTLAPYRNIHFATHGFLDRSRIAANQELLSVKAQAAEQSEISEPILRTSLPSRAIQEADALGNVTRFTCDSDGNLVTQVDASGNITHYVHSSAGQVMQITVPLGQTTNVSYDDFGGLISAADLGGNITSMIYDVFSRPDNIDTLRNNRGVVYDARNNQMIIFGDCGGERRPALDDISVLTSTSGLASSPSWTQIAPSGSVPVQQPSMTSVYSALGNRILSTNGDEDTVRFAYDRLVRPSINTRSVVFIIEGATDECIKANLVGFANFRNMCEALGSRVPTRSDEVDWSEYAVNTSAEHWVNTYSPKRLSADFHLRQQAGVRFITFNSNERRDYVDGGSGTRANLATAWTCIYGANTDRAEQSRRLPRQEQVTRQLPSDTHKILPTISTQVSPAPNASGWNNTDVNVTVTCADNISAVSICPTTAEADTQGVNPNSLGIAPGKAGDTATASGSLKSFANSKSGTYLSPNQENWAMSSMTINLYQAAPGRTAHAVRKSFVSDENGDSQSELRIRILHNDGVDLHSTTTVVPKGILLESIPVQELDSDENTPRLKLKVLKSGGAHLSITTEISQMRVANPHGLMRQIRLLRTSVK